MQCLTGENRTVKIEAATALGKIGPAAAEALLPLNDVLLKDHDGAVRKAAADAMGLISAKDAQPKPPAGEEK